MTFFMGILSVGKKKNILSAEEARERSTSQEISTIPKEETRPLTNTTGKSPAWADW